MARGNNRPKEIEKIEQFANSEPEIKDDSPRFEDSSELEKNKKEIKPENLLSSGSAVLNTACTDSPYGAFIAGRYYLLVGASSAGKTWLLLSVAAEATLNPKFSKYKIIHDNIEEGANMDLEFYFGEETAKKIKAPNYTDDGEPEYSVTIEQFYDNVDRELDRAEKGGYGILYLLDSMDALTSEAELKKSNEQREARESDKKTSGSMGDGKAKVNSQNLRRICSRLTKSGSMLFIVCQERDNIASPVGGKTFSGGNALLFYATLQIWLQHYKEIKTVIKGHERSLGNLSKISIKKNRLTGQKHKDVMIPFYHSFGIDDTGSIIDWLVEEGHWTGGEKETSKIDAEEFGVELNKEKLVQYIEALDDSDGRGKLYRIMADKWTEIKKDIQSKVIRKRRYI